MPTFLLYLTQTPPQLLSPHLHALRVLLTNSDDRYFFFFFLSENGEIFWLWKDGNAVFLSHQPGRKSQTMPKCRAQPFSASVTPMDPVLLDFDTAGPAFPWEKRSCCFILVGEAAHNVCSTLGKARGCPAGLPLSSLCVHPSSAEGYSQPSSTCLI